jgi:hypothetical protein
MEAKKKRHIKPGYEYDHLFPKPENDNKTIRRNANVYHTVSFIPKCVQETIEQTKLIAQKLKGRTIYDTCSNIWHFVYKHINYKKDEEGFEQIRSPSRTWHDRTRGVDCDCYSVIISSILTNLGIPHILRITKYHRDYFQHIYPIVPNGARSITIDCVTDQFDYEVPYSEKKDYPMDLQYLNGFDGDGTEDLGKIIKRNMSNKKSLPFKTAPKMPKKAMKKAVSNPATPASPGSSVAAPKKKKKGFLKKIANKINKINPATVLLRNGVLASMKLNIKNVAKRLRWSYLTPEQAAAKGIDPVKFQKLVNTRQKLENIFYGAGGNPSNLKKAILKGKGNKDKAVSGLGMLPMEEWAGYMNDNTPLQQLLGNDIYYSENVEGMNGFKGLGELGEPVTLATIGAAMGVIAGIAAALKQVGDIFKKKGKESEDFDEAKTDAPENNVSASVKTSAPAVSPIANSNNATSSDYNIPENIAERTSNNLPATQSRSIATSSGAGSDAVTDESMVAKTSSTNTAVENPADKDAKETDDKQGFWDNNKKWIKPVAIGVGGLTIIAIGYSLMKGKNAQNKASLRSHSLSGVPHKRKKKKNHHRKHQHHHKKAIALL